jgi:carboxyl-terminal processing protease
MRKFMLGGVLLLALSILGVVVLKPPAAVSAAGSDVYRQLNLFGDVFERVRSDYVEETDESQMIEAAINGMLSSLDPHSSYLNPKAFREMQVQTRGEFGGLGIEVTMENGLVKVIAPIDDTPAARAGVKTGDLITQIDGKQVLGLTLQEAVDKMRGPVNASITLTIQRAGLDQPFDLTLTRSIIKVQSVRSRREGDIGYIRISTFNEQTEAGLTRAVESLKSEIGANRVMGWVLDLRKNSGGLLDQAIAVSDSFLNQGEVVSTRGRKPGDAQRYNARRGDLAEGKPVVVIIDGGSASASEIVAGALQDHRRATVLGTKSFGKGSVQTIIPLPGQGALRLTTARYYTPSGRSIQAKGIEPDIEVKAAEAEIAAQNLPRSEADLPNHLLNPDEVAPAAKGAESDKLKDKTIAKPGAKIGTDGKAKAQSADAAKPEADKTEDVQLARALDYLRGLSVLSASGK